MTILTRSAVSSARYIRLQIRPRTNEASGSETWREPYHPRWIRQSIFWAEADSQARWFHAQVVPHMYRSRAVRNLRTYAHIYAGVGIDSWVFHCLKKDTCVAHGANKVLQTSDADQPGR